jgi:hypothetical protein
MLYGIDKVKEMLNIPADNLGCSETYKLGWC